MRAALLEETAPAGLNALIAPLSVETFTQKCLDKAPLHISGSLDKFPHLMSFERLNALLSMASFWTPQTLQFVRAGQMIDPRVYCAPLPSQNGVVLRPFYEKVMELLQQGAALVLNDVDALTLELRAVQRLLSQTFQAKVQANIYVSWKQKQAFKSHFDTHDVWAFQTVGEKVWHLYEGRADAPIAHPAFKNFGQAHHDHAKGALAAEILLKPGDILYIPRGIYHDALASSQASVHVTFGVTRPIGLDILSLLFEQALGHSFFRQNIPQTEPFRYLKHLEKECTQLLNSKEFRKMFTHWLSHFSTSFPEYTLDVDKTDFG